MPVVAAGDEPPMPDNSVSINGTLEQTIARLQIREICEGFPCHRDACEWSKMRALFAEKAWAFTTWSGGIPIDDFIKISDAGFKAGAFIMHRCSGCTVDLATSGPAANKRGLGKLKAIITQRFTVPAQDGGEAVVDVEAQCRLCFFVERNAAGEFKTVYFKGFYEKDKVIPVDPRKIPVIDDDKLKTFPQGYAYLAYFQSATHKILMDLPTRNGNEGHYKHYENIKKWLAGEDIQAAMGL